jgi:hypothetical protein
MPVFSLNPELTAEEVAQRDLLEYNEPILPIEGPLLEGPTEQIASLYLVNLPSPRSTEKQASFLAFKLRRARAFYVTVLACQTARFPYH